MPESNICAYWALEKNGIRIIDNDLDLAVTELHEKTAGFNFATKLRVKNDLKLDVDSLLTVDTSWIELKDDEFGMILLEGFDFIKNDSGKTLMYLNELNISTTSLKTLNGTEFTNKRSNVRFQYEELIAGIELSEADLQRGIVYLEFHFDHYTNPNNVCLRRYTGYTVPIKVKNIP